MTIGAHIAAALETVNDLGASFESSAALDCLDLINHSMKSLDNWKALHFKGTDSRETCTAEEPSIPTDDITYHSITEANTFTHYLAFRILCVVQAQSLHQQLHSVRSLPPALDVAESTLAENASSIMRSVKYLTRPEMKLYGAISLVLPLKVAYEYLEYRGCPGAMTLWERVARHINLAGHDFLYKSIKSDARILWPLHLG